MAQLHGLTKHKFYARWNSIVQRCNNENHKSYPQYGAKGVEINEVWSPNNPDGATNFIAWVEKEFSKSTKRHCELIKINFRVCRRNVHGNFEPSNCHLVWDEEFSQRRCNSALNVRTVIRMRRYSKANPLVTFTKIAALFNQSIQNVSRAVTGVSWVNANKIEPPLVRRNSKRTKTEDSQSAKCSTN
jgi:hypothetical protein